jgi:hypothetical protein
MGFAPLDCDVTVRVLLQQTDAQNISVEDTYQPGIGWSFSNSKTKAGQRPIRRPEEAAGGKGDDHTMMSVRR